MTRVCMECGWGYGVETDGSGDTLRLPVYANCPECDEMRHFGPEEAYERRQ